MEHKKYNRLHLRNHCYYIRVALPKDLWDLVKKKQLCYSLNTKDYYEAISLVRRESYKIDLLIDYLRKLKMELKNRCVVLTDMELNQILTYQMRMIDDACERNYNAIKKGNYTLDDLKVLGKKQLDEYNKETFDPNVPDEKTESTSDIGFITHQLNKLLYDYLGWLEKRPTTKVYTRELIEKIKQEELKLFQLTQNDKETQLSNQMLYFLHQLKDVEEYGDNKLLYYQGKLQNIPLTPLLESLTEAVKFQKAQEMSGTIQRHTYWKDVFDDMERPSNKGKNVKEGTIKQKRSCIETILQLIEKEYVEDITYDDCKKINRLIYRIPKKWKEHNPDKKLLEVLLPEDDAKNTISIKSVDKYITIFKEFLRYCRKERYTSEDLAGVLDNPKFDKNENHYLAFTTEELLKIFNPITYCKKFYKAGKDNPYFWVPLMGLYSGARGNELCQIRVDSDIKQEDGITYIETKDEKTGHPLQSLKNTWSRRRIPIHPVLKYLGFIKFINHQKAKKEEWLFPSLKYQKKHKFYRNVGRAFAEYLDELGIKDKRKVYHSFRHGTRIKLRDQCNASQEYIDAFCGWEGGGNAGNKDYGNRQEIPIRKLYECAEKLQYPELQKSFQDMKNRMRIMDRYK